jgi:hypothetical protein
MSTAHRFHTDVRGDSITVETQTRLPATSVQVLVNGRVVAIEQIHGTTARELTATLPGPPQRPVLVQIRRPHRHGAPECSVFVDSTAVPIQSAETPN